MQISDVEIRTENVMDRVKSRGRGFLGLLTANPKLTVGVSIVAFFILMALIAPLLSPNDPQFRYPEQSQAPSLAHWLGTTQEGYDVFAQLLYGAQSSLLVGFISAIGSTLLQIVFGLMAGYFTGLVGDIMTLIINVFLVLPGLPLAIVIATFAPLKGPTVLTVILLFTTWSYGARVLRAQTLSLKEREFVTAARASGETTLRIIFADILPNEIALVASSFVGTFVYTVLAEVALEFLGLGDVSHNSWGVMLYWAQNHQSLLAGFWWQFVPPGLCVALLCTGLSFLNFGIDELANPRLRREKGTQSRKSGKTSRTKTSEVVA